MKDQDENRFKILFIIVTWNRREILDRCLISLLKHIPYPHKILVVDNASSDKTSNMVKSEYPDVILIENTENLGFSKANNQGLMYLREHDMTFDYVIFFNDDAKLEDGSLRSLIDYMDKDKEVKACIPSVFTDQGKLQTGVGGYELSIGSAFTYFSFLSILFPQLFKGFFIHQRYYRKKGLILELDWISGVCFVMRREMAVLLRFDEDFFMYAEDIAICREIRQYGKVVYYPFARIFHQMKKNSTPESGTRWLDSLFRYYRTHNAGKNQGKLWILKGIFVFGFFLRALGYTILAGFSRSQYSGRKKVLLSYCRYIMRGFFR